MQETITQICRHSDSGHTPAELEGFVDERFRQALSGKNRIIYQVRDETVFIHLVIDTRRDLPALLQRIALRLM
ncbi:type II toxin-antitoxin system RelE/ParE family toxin [Paraburkholderia mimosarum]|uniref:type II toxin-antitoxin system RelE/ParE family toxin n=1 Tax=Paraburkholderia mimosarum TaxID=312026 RepID=UPI0039C2D704